jgi:hypothetical protein
MTPRPRPMSTLYLFKISQDVNKEYDTYDSAVVAAESGEDAVQIHPAGPERFVTTDSERLDTWAKAADVECEYLGEAKEGTERGVICASFNAG